MKTVAGVCLTVVVTVVAGVSPARAQERGQEQEKDSAAEAPSVAWPIVGVAAAGLGIYWSYDGVRRLADGEQGCIEPSGGCFWSGVVGGPLIALGGGALVAFYGWSLGEHHAYRDRAAGLAPKETRGMAMTAFVVAGAAVLANVVINQYVLQKTLSCNAMNAADVSECYGDQLKTIGAVQAVAGVVILGAVPFAGYGFGYDSYRKAHVSAQLTPLFLRGGGSGLALTARF